MNVRVFRGIVSVLFVLVLLACHKDKEDTLAKRTIIAYLAADNSLDAEISANVKDMMKGMQRKDCNLIVYFDGKSTAPELFAIVPNGTDTAEKRHLVSYPEENSASAATMRRVLEDAMGLYPAASYGLILGSHATGWLPANARFTRSLAGGFETERLEAGEERPRTRTFGEDAGQQIEIPDMADAIPEGFEFIFFDACMMSSIEVFYELREKTKYIIASPAEILAAGFPYAEILPYLWGNVNDLKSMCELFYNAHDKNSTSSFASVTLVDATKLEGLFTTTRQVLQGKKEEVLALPDSIYKGAIFKYPLINITNAVYFDLREFVKHIATDVQFRQFEEQLKQVVVYKEITNPFYTTSIPDKSRACGITSYIPRDAWKDHNPAYFNLSWAGIYQ